MKATLKLWMLISLTAMGACAANRRASAATADADTVAKPLTPASSLDDILDALHVRGDDLKDFTASVTLTTTDTSDQGSTVVSGHVTFQKNADGNSRIRVTFDQKIANDIVQNDAKHEYILDGAWLTELDYKKTKVIRRQVLKPGEKVNLLKLGEGPFPLPIGQDKQDVESMFDVKKIDLAKDDPANSVHIQLTPKPGTQFARKFTSIDVFVDLKTNMPIRIATLDKNKVTLQTTDLTDVKLNAGVPQGAFQPPAESSKWDIIEEPYSE